MPLSGYTDENDTEYAETLCKETSSHSAVVYFENTEKSGKHLGIDSKGKSILVHFSNGKGSADFEKIKGFTLIKKTEIYKYLIVDFKEPYYFGAGPFSDLGFGLIDQNCENILRKAIGNTLPIVEIK